VSAPDPRGYYTVRGPLEETCCESCGWPLYSGDRAYMSREGDVFCSRKHAGGDA